MGSVRISLAFVGLGGHSSSTPRWHERNKKRCTNGKQNAICNLQSSLSRGKYPFKVWETLTSTASYQHLITEVSLQFPFL